MKEQPRDRSPAIDVPDADALEDRDEESTSPREIPVDVPEADALEDRDGSAERRQIPVDVPEADALEQERDADLDDEDYRP